MCYKYLNYFNILERFWKVKNIFYFLNIIYLVGNLLVHSEHTE
jgi:hypothetical protein